MSSRAVHEPTAKRFTTRRQPVLMFSYFFPPLGGGVVQRTLKFVKYLPSEGFEPIVVAGRPDWRSVRDTTLNGDVPAQTIVVRAQTLPLHIVQWKLHGLLQRAGLPTRVVRRALLPDGQIGWLPAAIWHGLRMVKSRRPAVLYSTSLPETGHLAALVVHRLTGLPWVADFRDAWTLRPGPDSSIYTAPAHANAALERKVLAASSYATVACDSIQLLDRPRGDPRRIVIPNGVDPDDVTADSTAGVATTPNLLRLAHVGSLYGTRNAAPVFTALRELIACGRLDPTRFELRIVGHANPVDAELESIPTTLTGYVDHRRAVQEMASASVLLFHQPPEQLGSSSKIYEYLSTGRPILCVAHPDNAAFRLVRDLGAGECADGRDASTVVRAFERLLDRWDRGSLGASPDVREEALRRFSRRKLAGDMADVLRAAIAEQRPTIGPPRTVGCSGRVRAARS